MVWHLSDHQQKVIIHTECSVCLCWWSVSSPRYWFHPSISSVCSFCVSQQQLAAVSSTGFIFPSSLYAPLFLSGFNGNHNLLLSCLLPQIYARSFPLSQWWLNSVSSLTFSSLISSLCPSHASPVHWAQHLSEYLSGPLTLASWFCLS